MAATFQERFLRSSTRRRLPKQVMKPRLCGERTHTSIAPTFCARAFGPQTKGRCTSSITAHMARTHVITSLRRRKKSMLLRTDDSAAHGDWIFQGGKSTSLG